MMKGNKFKRLILIAGVLIILSVGGFMVVGMTSDDGLVGVKVYAVSQNQLSNTIYTTGKVMEADPVVVLSDVNALVKQVKVKKGEKVSKGEVMAVLDLEEHNVAIAKLQGDIVYYNEKIGAVREKLALSKEVANLQYKNKEQERIKIASDLEIKQSLFEQNSISEKELNEGKFSLQMFDNQLALLKKENEMKRAEVQSGIQDLERQIENTEIEIQQLQSKFKTLNPETGAVESPYNGDISSIQFKEGQRISEGDKLFEINKGGYLKLYAKVREEDVDQIKINNSVTVKGYSSEVEYEGKVTAIASFAYQEVIDNIKATFVDVEIDLMENSKAFNLGFNLDVIINTIDEKEMLSVHKDAVNKDEEGNYYVYVVKNGLVIRKSVTLGVKSSQYYEVEKGLAQGEQVVYYSTKSFSEGANVKIIE